MHRLAVAGALFMPWIVAIKQTEAAHKRDRIYDATTSEGLGWPSFGPARGEVASGATWSVMLRKWLSAQDELGLEPVGPSLARLPSGEALPHATLAAYLSGDISHLTAHAGVVTPQVAAKLPRAPEAQYGGFYHLFKARGHCAAAIRGVLVVYFRIYKAGNSAICINLQKLHDGSIALRKFGTKGDVDHRECSTRIYSQPPAQRVLFTATVEPIKRMISAYGEVSRWRTSPSRDKKFVLQVRKSWFSYLTPLRDGDPSVAARAFVEDVLLLRLGPSLYSDMADIHAFPQVSFLQPRSGMGPLRASTRCALHNLPSGRLDLVGDISSIDILWATIGARVGVAAGEAAMNVPAPARGPGLAGLLANSSSSNASRSEAAAGSEPQLVAPSWWPPFDHSEGKHEHLDAHRDAMARLLREHPPIMRAVCRIYLPDFTCLNYSLPGACAGMDRQFARSQLGRKTLEGCPRPIVNLLPLAPRPLAQRIA
jgi:hypothetical protein